MPSLAEIRALLKAEQEKAENVKNGTFTGTNQPDSFLAFWNIDYNKPLYLRFLPDADQSNPYFWREREMINLTFSGVKGLHTDMVKVQVPCNEMWVPKSCPVINEVRQWFALANETNDEALKKQASSYWKKKSFLFQGFVAPDSTEVKNDVPPENPIRRFLFTKDICDKVKSILLNPGISELPIHFDHGRDFGVIKAKNGGGYNNYDQSQFSMSERPLSAEERAAIEQYGLFNLNDFMPKQPTEEELNAIKEMFEASVDGEAYDPARWAAFYRPAGVQKPQANTVTTSTIQSQQAINAAQKTPEVTTPEVQSQTVNESKPAAEASVKPQTLPTNDLLARLRGSKS